MKNGKARLIVIVIFCLFFCAQICHAGATQSESKVVPANPEVRSLVEKLKLVPLPEVKGGYFRETYRSGFRTGGKPDRSCATMIYFLLTGKVVDRFHKVKSDEILLYQGGRPAVQMLLFPDGSWEERVIGCRVEKGEVPQSVVPAGTWMSLSLTDQSDDSWGLFGCMVAPGFEYDDYTQGDSSELAKKYPAAEKRMRELGLK